MRLGSAARREGGRTLAAGGKRWGAGHVEHATWAWAAGLTGMCAASAEDGAERTCDP